ncbi:MAG: radical SAM family heme chaperone HemW [Candidatus Margulisiibacteriota bacterium]
MTASLYVHIPFCKQKCNYCDFVSYAGKENFIDEYVETMIREFESRCSVLYVPCSTVFFGGGTPTLLEPKHFDKILSTFISHSSLVISHSEISIEANPGTAGKAKLKALRQLGINRLSIGVQSFNDRQLKTLGRIHDSATAKRFYQDARDAGFDNINLDLIFALPGQTLAEWKRDLATAIALKPEHLSTYNLQIEEGTPFWERFKEPSPAAANRRTLSQRERVMSQADLQNTFSPPHPLTQSVPPLPEGEGTSPLIPVCATPSPFGRRCASLAHWMRGEKVHSSGRADEGLSLPSEDEELAMYEYAIEELAAHGYKHYEISNFAKPGYECQHNLVYWRNENYLGIGAGAHSHVNGQRWSNPNCIEKYLETATFSRRFPGSTADQRETIFLGLRLLDGLSIKKFKGFEAQVAELIKDGLLTEEKGNYKLTRQGLYLGNLVFEKFV